MAGRPKDPRRVVSVARWHSLRWLLSSCRESHSNGPGQAQRGLILSNVRVDKVAEGPGLAGAGRGWRPRWMPGGASRAAVSPAVVLDVVTHQRPRVIGSVRTSYSPMIVHSTPSCAVEYVLRVAYHIPPMHQGWTLGREVVSAGLIWPRACGPPRHDQNVSKRRGRKRGMRGERYQSHDSGVVWLHGHEKRQGRVVSRRRFYQM